MILLLDPFDTVVNVNQGIESISQEKILEALCDMHFVLSHIPIEQLQNVTEIKFINPVAKYLYEISETTFKKFKKSVPRESKYLYQLINKSTMLNLYSISESSAFAESLMKDGDEYIFFDILLTNNLILYLSACNKISGYRLIKKPDYNEWKEIEDIERYLGICSALFYRFIGREKYQKFLDESKEGIRDSFIDIMINRLENENVLKHLIIINNWEEEDIKALNSVLIKKYGFFQSYFCGKGHLYNLPKATDNLLVYDLDYLDTHIQVNLIRELFTGDYKDRIVIIYSSMSVDTRSLPGIDVWLSTQGFIGFFNTMNEQLLCWSEIMDSKSAEYNNILQTIGDDDQESKDYYPKLNSLTNGSLDFNWASVDFWYDNKYLELYDKKDLENWARELRNKYFPAIKKIKYEFRQEGNYWTIIVDNVEEISKKEKRKKQINYIKSKAIRYLVYVIKYFGVNNPIAFADLSRSVSIWMDGSEKVVAYHTFSESIDKLFKNYPDLKPIVKYFYYNDQQRGIYYQENSEIEIDLSQIDIPFQQLNKNN